MPPPHLWGLVGLRCLSYFKLRRYRGVAWPASTRARVEQHGADQHDDAGAETIACRTPAEGAEAHGVQMREMPDLIDEHGAAVTTRARWSRSHLR